LVARAGENNHVRAYVAHDNGACAYDGVRANRDTLTHICPNSDPRGFADSDLASEMCARTDMHTIRQLAIVVDRSGGINNAAATETRERIHDRARAQHRPSAERRVATHDRGWMHHRRQGKSPMHQLALPHQARTIVTDGDDDRVDL